MRVQILSFEEKPITTKTGQQMVLRVIQGFTSSGSVFKDTLSKEHPPVKPGEYELVGMPYVNFECKLGYRSEYRPVSKSA